MSADLALRLQLDVELAPPVGHEPGRDRLVRCFAPPNGPWSYYAKSGRYEALRHSIGYRLLEVKHGDRESFMLEILARELAQLDDPIGLGESRALERLGPRSAPALIVRCPECQRWNYHLVSCSRRFR